MTEPIEAGVPVKLKKSEPFTLSGHHHPYGGESRLFILGPHMYGVALESPEAPGRLPLLDIRVRFTISTLGFDMVVRVPVELLEVFPFWDGKKIQITEEDS